MHLTLKTLSNYLRNHDVKKPKIKTPIFSFGFSREKRSNDGIIDQRLIKVKHMITSWVLFEANQTDWS